MSDLLAIGLMLVLYALGHKAGREEGYSEAVCEQIEAEHNEPDVDDFEEDT